MSSPNPHPHAQSRPGTSRDRFSRHHSPLNLNAKTASTDGLDIPQAPATAMPALGSQQTPRASLFAWGLGHDVLGCRRRPSLAAAAANAMDFLPRQTIAKALASVSAKSPPSVLQLRDVLSALDAAWSFENELQNSPSHPATRDPKEAIFEQNHGQELVSQDPTNELSTNLAVTCPTAESQQIANTLNNLHLVSDPVTPSQMLPALLSPCFFHQGLDSAVNIEQVLDMVNQAADGFSPSRLVQTATSVRQMSKQLQRRPIRRPIRSIMIVTKARDNQLVYLTRELALWLIRTPRYDSDLGVNVYVDAKLRTSRRFAASAIVAENARFAKMLRYWTPDLCWTKPEVFDLVLTLGGDGTVLFTSWLFQRVVPPVLPFALGSLGFLTPFDFGRYRDQVGKIMGSEGMRISLRMRFTCTVYRGSGQEESEQFEVLNELVIDRGPSSYVSNLELYGDGELLTVVQADGCIFSTPTGSTAYSLSAGGSLVHPDIPCILLTPICPHTLSFRPMVLSDTMLLRVSVPSNSRATAYCAFDGKGRIELRQGDYVTISASQYPFPTVIHSETEWFDSVSSTLRWNTRAASQKPFDSSSVAADPITSFSLEGNGSTDCTREPEWDIDFDTDSACYLSEDGSVSASPLRTLSLLTM